MYDLPPGYLLNLIIRKVSTLPVPPLKYIRLIQIIELCSALALCFLLTGIIQGAISMTKKQGISRLLHDLQEFYYRLCAMDLRKRMSLYHRNTGTSQAPDISTSLINHLDKLTPINKSNRAGTASTTETMSSIRPVSSDNSKQPGRSSRRAIRMVNGFIQQKNIYTRIKPSDQYMGEKLKDSTWSHIHTAMLHARKGDIMNAKLHAGIANDALKQAAHYLSEEDYKILCEEVAKAFNKLEK
jgi:hypothetical protein